MKTSVSNKETRTTLWPHHIELACLDTKILSYSLTNLGQCSIFILPGNLHAEAATGGHIKNEQIKKVFLKISQNSQNNTSIRVFTVLACSFTKKEILAQMFSCEFYEIFKSPFFPEYLRASDSLYRNGSLAWNELKM